MSSEAMFVLHTVGVWGPLLRRLVESHGGAIGEDASGGYVILELSLIHI